MVFSSTVFLFVFLPVTLAGYYLIRKDLRNAFLLVMSLVFYAWGEPYFVWIMLLSIAVNYTGGLLIWKFRSGKSWKRKSVLAIAVVLNLSILFYYKYFDFAVANVNRVFSTSFALRYIALPIGISFFTFQGMSYVIDVYRGDGEAQKNPLNVAIYIAMFPQLIAGPIVRYATIHTQILQRHETLDTFAQGVQRFAVGLAKKVLIANTVAKLADLAFDMDPSLLGPGMAWMGLLAYTLQIYFDFSGYSDMAIGLGKMFGFHFLENFNYPYSATSMTNFWRKWHISLSTWFRDYVYIPMGGNRRGNVYVHLFAIFFLTGLWHGASWQFVAWGFWHGCFLVIERLFRTRKFPFPVPKALQWLYTLLVVMIGWVMFRAPNLGAAVEYLRCMVGLGGADTADTLLKLGEYAIVLGIGALAAMPVLPWIRKRLESAGSWLQTGADWTAVVLCAVLLVLGISYTVTSTFNPFIYFNF